MNISKKMQDAFNAQIAAEMWSSNLYLQMACWFRKEGWKGFSSWMYKQAEEERQHAMDMAQFVLHRGGEVLLTSIDAVKTSWTDAKEAFVDTFEHEQKVTELINKLADVTDEEKDRASQNFIAKYIDEQVEEEKNVKDILDSFAHLASHAIAHIDSKLEKAL